MNIENININNIIMVQKAKILVRTPGFISTAAVLTLAAVLILIALVVDPSVST